MRKDILITFSSFLAFFLLVLFIPAKADECGPCHTYELSAFVATLVSGAGCPCPKADPLWTCVHTGLRYYRSPEAVSIPDQENIYFQEEIQGAWEVMLKFNYDCVCWEGGLSCGVFTEEVFVPYCMECPAIIEDE